MTQGEPARGRVRDFAIRPGQLPCGPLNAITDVTGVLVGHVTLIEGEDTRTGVTAVRPHSGNLYQDRVPAGVSVGNGFGKLAGVTQVQELGELETPVVLTNTLCVSRGLDGLIDWTLHQPGNETVRSVNAVVGETNDGLLNDIRSRAVTPGHVLSALENAVSGPVPEGAVGAGTGTVAFGWKGGIGTSSRRAGEWTVGVLVQSNYGGQLTVCGVPLDLAAAPSPAPDGSVMILVATDAPLSDRNLTRLARRAFLGIARTGGFLANGSGDYAVAFSTHPQVRRTSMHRNPQAPPVADLANELTSPLFQAVVEATEEAVLNSLFMASTVRGHAGRTVEALPLEPTLQQLRRAGVIPG
ncbi:DmpA family aminopeptidase [Deinococcus malanensis]|nr:P1 family peptidase [Deinococcus malanensis]